MCGKIPCSSLSQSGESSLYDRRLEYVFLAFALLLLCFLSALSRYICLHRVASSVQQSSATTYMRSCSVICVLSRLDIPFVSFVYYFVEFLVSWLACSLCSSSTRCLRIRFAYLALMYSRSFDWFSVDQTIGISPE